MEDFFELLNNLDSVDVPEVSLTKDQWIAKAVDIFESINKKYGNCWHSTGETTDCTRCGFGYIEQGGETVDCPNCHGTGQERCGEKSLNIEELGEEMNELIDKGNIWKLLSTTPKD